MDSIRIQRLGKVALFATVLCLLLAVTSAVLAQKSTGGLISLDVADIELSAVVRMLARDGGQNIVIADHEKLNAKVSATLTNVTLDTALRYIVESAGCTWSREADGTYIIGGKAKVEAKPSVRTQPRTASLADDPSLATVARRDVRFESLKLQNTSPVDMMWLLGAYSLDQALEIEKSPNKPGVDLTSPLRSRNSTPPLIDTQLDDSIEAGRTPSLTDEAAQGGPPPFQGGRPSTSQNQPPTGQGGAQTSNTQSLMPEGIDYLMPYPADNSLLVKGTPEGIEELHELIKKLDIAPRQVSIKAEFVEVNTSESSNLGIDWSIQRMGSVFETQFAPGGNVIFGYANGNVMANLRTQVLQNKAKVVNAPIISTLNNVPASISIQKQIPYWTSSSYYGTNNSQTTQQVNMLTIHSTLMVLPRINGDQSITVTLQPQVADQGEIYTGPDNTKLPAVNQQQLTTTRRVMNGETIVVGGIIRKTENNSVTGIPLLKDLPIVGPLFKSTNKSTEDRELLIFLTPTIIPERSTAGTGVGIEL